MDNCVKLDTFISDSVVFITVETLAVGNLQSESANGKYSMNANGIRPWHLDGNLFDVRGDGSTFDDRWKNVVELLDDVNGVSFE